MFQAGDDSTLFLSQELSSASDLMQTLDAKGDQVIRRRTYYLSVLGVKSSYVTDLMFAVRNNKKSPNQETALGNRGPLVALNDRKLILNG